MPPTTPPKHIHTSRLTLRLLSTSTNPRDLALFHENWSSRDATMWSMRGATKTLDESREWMDELVSKGLQFYAIFLQSRSESEGTGNQDVGADEEKGAHVGSVCLRLPSQGLMMMPRGDWGGEGDEYEAKNLGYALFKEFWGLGIATEAGKALIESYRVMLREKGKKGYIEGCVDAGNPASGHVLKKIGFEEIGWKTHEPVWINGDWRNGCWVYGMYA